MNDSFRDECAVMGVSLPHWVGTAPRQCYEGLRQLQHRGQDGSGMAIGFRSVPPRVHKELGLVLYVYPEEWLKTRSSLAIGHNRYSTQGRHEQKNLQPHRAVCRDGPLYLASNGDVTNFRQMRRRLQRQGVRFQSQNDGELLAWYLATAYDQSGSMQQAIRSLFGNVEGAYSVVMLFQQSLWAFRDPQGIRPLTMTRLPDGGMAVASETIAFDILGADPMLHNEIGAGAIIEVTDGEPTFHATGHTATALCSFERIYFARPDSIMTGIPVELSQRRIGWQLARESGFKQKRNAIVVAVPDSANAIARGVAEELGLRLEAGLMRSHVSLRTFIASEQRVREDGVKFKHNPNRLWLEGMTVLLVDDSIVRGTTMHKIVRMLQRAGTSAIHLLIGSPPIRWPCYLGIATPTRSELIANSHSHDEMVEYLDVDSLTHLSLDGLRLALGPITDHELRRFGRTLAPVIHAPRGTLRRRTKESLACANPSHYCYGCFTGSYPVDVSHLLRKEEIALPAGLS